MKTSDKPTQILNVTSTISQLQRHQLRRPIYQVRQKNTKHANQNTKYTKPKTKYTKQKTKHAKIHQVFQIHQIKH